MLVVPVVVALVAAFSNALAGHLQQGASKQVPGRHPLQFRLLIDLGRSPRWLFGSACDVAAFLLQATALAFGTLILVQPLLVTSLLMVVGIRSFARRRAPKRRTWIAALLTAGGLAAFLVVARPSPGNPRAPADWGTAALGGVLALLFAGCLVAASRTHENKRAVALATAAGLLYGSTAGLAKIFTGQFARGVFGPFQHWQVYVAVVLGIAGAQLSQVAFQAGALAAPVALITVTDPLTSIAIGLVWLGESVHTGWGDLLLEALGLVSMIVGIVLLAQETPQVAREPGDEGSQTADRHST